MKKVLIGLGVAAAGAVTAAVVGKKVSKNKALADVVENAKEATDNSTGAGAEANAEA